MRLLIKSDQDIFLEKSSDNFFEIPFHLPEALKLAKQKIHGKNYPRQELVKELLNYNLRIGNDLHAIKQIESLADDKRCCVVTGQQLGLMSGPIYTILKGISCLATAKAADAVPIFWLATEDHDIHEIDHAFLLDPLGNLQKFQLNFPKDGRCVEDLFLGAKNIEISQAFLTRASLPQHFWPEWTDSYAKTMAQFMVRLFAGTGMVFLEPKIFRSMSRTFFQKEIKECREIRQILQATTARLAAAGVQPAIVFQEGDTNLFLKDPYGARRKIQIVEDKFLCGDIFLTLNELLRLAETSPDRLSCNVAARPVLQNSILPTMATIAGPSEMVYYQQLKDYHYFHEAMMPCIIPRHSATFIPPYAASLLEKCGLQPWEVLPHSWNAFMPEVTSEIEKMKEAWQLSAERHFGNEVSPHSIARYIQFGARKLHRKVCKMRLHKKGLPSHGLHLLRNLLHPHEKMQERVLNWCFLQGTYDGNLIKDLLDSVSWKSEGHIYCFI